MVKKMFTIVSKNGGRVIYDEYSAHGYCGYESIGGIFNEFHCGLPV
jgi:hypothetical protein